MGIDGLMLLHCQFQTKNQLYHCSILDLRLEQFVSPLGETGGRRGRANMYTFAGLLFTFPLKNCFPPPSIEVYRFKIT